MAVNPKRGEVEVILGGEPRVMKWNFNTLSDFESRMGLTAAKIGDTLSSGDIPIKFTIGGVAAGLAENGQRLTERQIGAVFSENRDELAGASLAVLRGFLLAAIGDPAAVDTALSGVDADTDTEPGAPQGEASGAAGIGPTSSAPPTDAESAPTTSGD